MRVLYFHQHFSTPKGSAGIRSYEMSRRLISRGHRVTMVCGSYGGGETGLNSEFLGGVRRGNVEGIDIIEFDLAYSNSDGFAKRAITFLKYAWKSVGIALFEKYDVLFATTTPLTAGIPGIFARWIRRKPFVFEVRDLWPELPKAMGVIKNPVILALMSILEWASYHSAHRLVGLSSGICDGIFHRGIPRERIRLIPNGCDLDIFSDTGDHWRPAGVRESDLLAVFAGTHGIANGLDVVLDTGIELQKRNRDDIKILLIGQGKLKKQLLEKAQRLDLKTVVFHEPVNKKRLSGLFASADLGLQILANIPAFYYGTSPNKFFDYLSAGLPVVTNYPGWVAELINTNQCGYVVPPEDPQKFADALENASSNRQNLGRQGENARRLAEREFDRMKLADSWVEWVEGAMR